LRQQLPACVSYWKLAPNNFQLAFSNWNACASYFQLASATGSLRPTTSSLRSATGTLAPATGASRVLDPGSWKSLRELPVPVGFWLKTDTSEQKRTSLMSTSIRLFILK